MGNFKKWEKGLSHNSPVYGVLFVSRNKDNAGVDGFTERRHAFVTAKSVKDLMTDFEHFVSKGLPGEMSRFYYSVNERDQKKSKRAFLEWLLDIMIEDVNFSIAGLSTKIAAIAMQPENAKTKKWLLDFDEDESKLDEFIQDAKDASTHYGGPEIEVTVHKTPNGYGIVCSHGFDKQLFAPKWGKDVIKTDDMLCVSWKRKEK